MMNRLTYQIKKDKEIASNDFLSYEKIRWPCYKDMVMRRKNQAFLPTKPSEIKKMLGLTRAAPVKQPRGETTVTRGDSSTKIRRLDSASSA